jgi:hypothetical protein
LEKSPGYLGVFLYAVSLPGISDSAETLPDSADITLSPLLKQNNGVEPKTGVSGPQGDPGNDNTVTLHR